MFQLITLSKKQTDISCGLRNFEILQIKNDLPNSTYALNGEIDKLTAIICSGSSVLAYQTCTDKSLSHPTEPLTPQRIYLQKKSLNRFKISRKTTFTEVFNVYMYFSLLSKIVSTKKDAYFSTQI